MSYTTIWQLFKELFKLDISRGMLCKATQKVSQALHRPYQQLLERLAHESYLGVDETGHHDAGKLHWTWCFQRPTYSLFHIEASRGSGVLEKILGNDFAGILCADYWGAYRKYARLFNVNMQYCMAHLIREIRFLAEHRIKKLVHWGNELLGWLKKMFRALHGRNHMSAPGFLRAMKRLKEGFLKRMRRPPNHPLAKKLARRFKGKAADDYFRFLIEPDVEPTNNSTERAIRHVVIDRRITQGTRGQVGMRWSERIWTTIATCKKQNRNVFEFINQSLLAYWNNACYPQLL
jgi:transposase